MNWFKSLSDMIRTKRYPSYEAMLGRIVTFAGDGKITIEQAEELKLKLDEKEGKV